MIQMLIRRGKLFMNMALCGVSEFALRLHGEPIWVRDSPDPNLHEAPLIRNRTTFKCYIAIGSIPTSCHTSYPGHRFNIKMYSYQYRKSHCGDKTVVRSSYLHGGISNTGKMSSLYWIGALLTIDFFFVDCVVPNNLPKWTSCFFIQARPWCSLKCNGPLLPSRYFTSVV